MADNFTQETAADKTFASDQIGGVDYERVKLTIGVDGAGIDASASNPVPTTSRSVSRGFRKITATTTATLISTLTVDGIPASSSMVLLRPYDGDIRLLDDAGTLTSSFGYFVPAGAEFNYDGNLLTALKLIGIGGSVIVDAWYYS